MKMKSYFASQLPWKAVSAVSFRSRGSFAAGRALLCSASLCREKASAAEAANLTPESELDRLLKAGKREEATKFLISAARRASGEERDRHLAQLATLYESIGDWRKAAGAWRKIAEEGNEDYLEAATFDWIRTTSAIGRNAEGVEAMCANGKAIPDNAWFVGESPLVRDSRFARDLFGADLLFAARETEKASHAYSEVILKAGLDTETKTFPIYRFRTDGDDDKIHTPGSIAAPGVVIPAPTQPGKPYTGILQPNTDDEIVTGIEDWSGFSKAGDGLTKDNDLVKVELSWNPFTPRLRPDMVEGKKLVLALPPKTKAFLPSGQLLVDMEVVIGSPGGQLAPLGGSAREQVIYLEADSGFTGGEIILYVDGLDKPGANGRAMMSPADLAIHNGQAAPNSVPDKDEEKIGAFTVANLNDTDGDGIIDNVDDKVKRVTDGTNEEDLMKLGWETPDGQLIDNVDTVKATAVWAEKTSVKKANGDVLWTGAKDPLKDTFNNTLGSVFGPNFTTAQSGSFHFTIGFEFTVMPSGIGQEPGVAFDITRDIAHKDWSINGTVVQQIIIPGKDDVFDAGDVSDDDSVLELDEDVVPTNNKIYTLDGPGDDLAAINDQVVSRNNFEEFVRVSFNGMRPTGENDDGSRCSENIPWHAFYWVEKDPGTNPIKYRMRTGKLNVVDEGHLPLGTTPTP